MAAFNFSASKARRIAFSLSMVCYFYFSIASIFLFSSSSLLIIMFYPLSFSLINYSFKTHDLFSSSVFLVYSSYNSVSASCSCFYSLTRYFFSSRSRVSKEVVNSMLCFSRSSFSCFKDWFSVCKVRIILFQRWSSLVTEVVWRCIK